jgi:hypothetical protein
VTPGSGRGAVVQDGLAGVPEGGQRPDVRR